MSFRMGLGIKLQGLVRDVQFSLISSYVCSEPNPHKSHGSVGSDPTG